MSAAAPWMLLSLCRDCRHKREITSGAGSQFWLCQLAAQEQRFRKYPPQPVARCAGHLTAIVSAADPELE